MTDPTYGAAAQLASLAATLGGPRGALPAFFAFTDPDRTPDPVMLAQKLPPGSGLVLRTFGKPEIKAMAPTLAIISEWRQLTFLIAADPDLAIAAGADGVHWPQAQLSKAAKTRFRGLQTASAHSPMAVRRATGLVDAVFVSTAFSSQSPSASRPMGPFRLQAYGHRSQLPIYALGGINSKTIKRLTHTQLSGAAAIGAVSS